MSDNKEAEQTSQVTAPKKNLKDIWMELAPKSQFRLKIGAAVAAVIVVFGVGFTAGYEKAKADVRLVFEQAFSGLDAEESTEATEEPVEKDVLAEVGTRENPAPMGTTVIFSDNSGDVWEVTLSDPILNAADVVANENMFNDPAPEGFQFAMVTVTAKYIGKETGTPAWDLTIDYVSAAGTTHTTGDTYAVVPNALMDVNELYPDAIGVGNIVIAVPVTDVESGNWTISAGYGNEKYFYKAQ